MKNKSYTIMLGGFNYIESDSPLNAAKKLAQWISEDNCANRLVYDVIDEQTGEKFTVDLAEEDEDAVLPNNN